MLLGQTNIITYILVFVSLYFEVFLLITFFEKIKETKEEEKHLIYRFKTATIIVPVFNEEKTIFKTVDSLLNLNYPKDKYRIIIVDDGSQDQTWNTIQQFKNHPQIDIYHKENGGKWTALNFAIEKATTEIIGCLDADSFVDSEALRRIVSYFEDTETMAVTPAVKIYQPDNLLRQLQCNEYNLGVFNKKMFGHLGAINITPGPFSFFRREVFEKIGPFRHAHNTEDMEIAMRLQKNGYKIVNAHQALVYTVGPKKYRDLYKQRLRWVYGYFKNLIDYRQMIFKKKHGNLGLFFLPASILMLLAAFYYTVTVVLGFGEFIYEKILLFRAVGWHWKPVWHFDWFYFNTDSVIFFSLLMLGLTIIVTILGIKLSENRFSFNWHMLYFPLIYPIMSIVWLSKAVYNVLTARKPTWR